MRYLLLSLIGFFCQLTAHADPKELLNLSVEDLLNVEVVSVSKKAQSLNDSPAAIYVITHEDIKRIGARSIPEALRLAPGVDVARIDAHRWAVSIRGFNSRFANKLLVLIDGRNAYTRAFSGVYWEQQDVMLEDVDRIEVIRGPGGTLWGANAVNGVINIITKHSSDTQGGLVTAGGGTEEHGFGAFRMGTQLSPDITARAYVKGGSQDSNSLSSETQKDGGDDWEKIQTGFRMDSQYSLHDSLTIQGDAYYNWIRQKTVLPQTAPPYQQAFNENIENVGGNLLLRQQHAFSSTSNYSLQAYYDFYQIKDIQRDESRHAIDIDFQHRFALLGWSDVVWGLRYRYSHDNFTFRKGFAGINPESRNDQLVSGFVQDEITLIDHVLWFTIGSKFEHNDYSGFEVQPSARLMWIPHHKHRLWAAVSRAVRTPSRVEQDLSLLQNVIVPPPVPVAVTINGNREYESEEVISYEMGYRTTMIDQLSVDFTAFYNRYDNLRSVLIGTPVFNGGLVSQPLTFINNNQVQSYGLEIATVWQMKPWLRWDIHYSLLKMDFSNHDAFEEIGQSPQQRVSLRSVISPLENIDLDILFRYVDRTTVVGTVKPIVINDYSSLDIRLAWRPKTDLELSLVGQNLLAAQHQEYTSAAFSPAVAIDRGTYAKIAWHF